MLFSTGIVQTIKLALIFLAATIFLVFFQRLRHNYQFKDYRKSISLVEANLETVADSLLNEMIKELSFLTSYKDEDKVDSIRNFHIQNFKSMFQAGAAITIENFEDAGEKRVIARSIAEQIDDFEFVGTEYYEFSLESEAKKISKIIRDPIDDDAALFIGKVEFTEMMEIYVNGEKIDEIMTLKSTDIYTRVRESEGQRFIESSRLGKITAIKVIQTSWRWVIGLIIGLLIFATLYYFIVQRSKAS